jgi:hypothetical protein
LSVTVQRVETHVREEAIKLLTRITKVDKKYIPNSWETYTKTQIWPRNGEVNLKGVQTLLRLMDEEGALKKPLPKPEDIVDSSYLEEARRRLAVNRERELKKLALRRGIRRPL